VAARAPTAPRQPCSPAAAAQAVQQRMGYGRSRVRGGARGGGRRGRAAASSVGARVIEINKRIKACGDARQIDQALAAFASLDSQGLQPTAVSFNVILFALVKCGELQQATQIYQRMLARTDVQPNVVTLTSLLKGHCAAGDMQSAWTLLDGMARQGPSGRLRPNTRTLNTFLRGCLWTGDVERAVQVFRQLCDGDGGGSGGGGIVSPDVTSVDYLLRLLTMSLRLDEARHVYEAHTATIEGAPSPPLGLATACALRGDVAAARHWLARAASVLNGTAAQPLSDGDSDGESRGPGEGGARAAKLANFIAHQRTEMLDSVDRIRLALGHGSSDTRSPPPQPHTNKRKRSKEGAQAALQPLKPPALLQSALCRTVLFSSTGRVGFHLEAGQDREAMVKGLVARLESLGLPPCRRTGAGGGGDSIQRKVVSRRIGKAIGNGGRLRLPRLFDRREGEQRLINLEVCAGSGEWICEMAAAHPEQDWAAVELRHNRCGAIVSRGVLQGGGGCLSNLAVLGGDAAIICAHHIKKASVTNTHQPACSILPLHIPSTCLRPLFLMQPHDHPPTQPC
jgi:pentatricopeptide repeat protein